MIDDLIRIARLVKTCEAIKGRKKFQKMVHILQDLGHPFDQRFEYHHYGPYSFSLRSAVDEAVEWDLLAETEGADDDYTPFVYRPGRSLDDVLQVAARSEEPPSWADLARRLNERSANDLEAISTIMFLERSGLHGAALQERFSDL